MASHAIIICGYPAVGKTTLGGALAQLLGLEHVEMSAMVRASLESQGASEMANAEYVQSVLWHHGEFGAVAELLMRTRPNEQLVITGPRRPEEIEVLRACAPSTLIYLTASFRTRLKRAARRPTRGGVARSQVDVAFRLAKRDQQESAWGMDRIPQMHDCHVVVNEDSPGRAVSRILMILSGDAGQPGNDQSG